MLIIKNINLTNTPNLANPNYTILVSQPTNNIKQTKSTNSNKGSTNKANTPNKTHNKNKA